MNYFLKVITAALSMYPGVFLFTVTAVVSCAVFKTWGWSGIAKMATLYFSLLILIIIGYVIFDFTMWIINN